MTEEVARELQHLGGKQPAWFTR